VVVSSIARPISRSRHQIANPLTPSRWIVHAEFLHRNRA
jgi:hypothetical protein